MKSASVLFATFTAAPLQSRVLGTMCSSALPWPLLVKILASIFNASSTQRIGLPFKTLYATSPLTAPLSFLLALLSVVTFLGRPPLWSLRLTERDDTSLPPIFTAFGAFVGTTLRLQVGMKNNVPARPHEDL